MAPKNKSQLLNQAFTLLKKQYKLEPSPARLSVLEATIYAVCHEETTREQANQVLSRFKDTFFDWNEVRVSSLEEIQGVLAGMPHPEDRAYKIRRFLRQLFEKTYAFNLDQLAKKPLKESAKVLHEYEAFTSDYVLAAVIQQALGGHAIPIDGAIRRVLERLSVADQKTDNAALRSTLERAIPKSKGSEFVDLLEELAHEICIDPVPLCPRCELRKICPVGQKRKADPPATKAAPSKDGAKGASKDGASKDGASKDGAQKDGAKGGKKPKSAPGKSPRPK